MIQSNKASISTKLLLATLLFSGLGASLWYYTSHHSQGIYAYEPTVDRAFIIDLFKNDWYWLISDYSSKDYSVEHMLDNRASSKEHSGDLIIKTYRVAGKPVGFMAYYPKELFEGYILFLAVDKKHRSKGYARKMLTYAINDFKKQGIRVVRLITRTDNLPGQKLYKNMGFKQIWTDGAYVKFEKVLE